MKSKFKLYISFVNENSNIYGTDAGAVSIEQSPNEFGEVNQNTGAKCKFNKMRKRAKRFKFKRKIK